MSKRCPCGDEYYRHGKAPATKTGLPEGERYKCKECGTCITVRAGEKVHPQARPRVVDWRCQP